MVQNVIFRTEMYNKSVFSIFLIPGENQVTIEEHVESGRVPGSWATQVEVVAAASAFEIPIYYYSIDKKSQKYTWKVVHPYSSTKQKLKLPEFPEVSKGVSLQMPTHFELLYYDSLHYDAIVCETTGRVCSTPPTLSYNHSRLVV